MTTLDFIRKNGKQILYAWLVAIILSILLTFFG